MPINFFFVLLFSMSKMLWGEDDSKLRVGVKKRIENCKEKSKYGDFLTVLYMATLDDGRVIDSNFDRKDNPLTFTLGSGQVIRGFDLGLVGMCVGEKRKLRVPPEYGYGYDGIPPKIPKNATLSYEVELLAIEKKAALPVEKKSTLLEEKKSTLPEEKKSTLPEEKKSTLPEEKKSTLPEEKKSTLPEEKKSTLPVENKRNVDEL